MNKYRLTYENVENIDDYFFISEKELKDFPIFPADEDISGDLEAIRFLQAFGIDYYNHSREFISIEEYQEPEFINLDELL